MKGIRKDELRYKGCFCLIQNVKILNVQQMCKRNFETKKKEKKSERELSKRVMVTKLT